MAGKNKKSDFFWVSYADLMTTLFFIMLVLFVLTVVYLKQEQTKVNIENKILKRIVQLKEQFKPLQESGEFHYLEDCKKFIAKDLMGKEIFEPGKTKILSEFVDNTITVG